MVQRHYSRQTTWVIVMSLMITASAYGRDTIRLHPRAHLTGTSIVLADVADITADTPAVRERLSRMVVTTLDDDAQQAVVDMFDVQRTLAQAGINPAGLDFYGASQCQLVRQTTEPVSASKVEQEESRPSTKAVAAEADKGGGGDLSGAEGSLADALVALVAQAVGCEPSRLMIDWKGENQDILEQSYDSRCVEIKSHNRLGLGDVGFEVKIRKPADTDTAKGVVPKTEPSTKHTQGYRINGRVEYLCESVVAKTSLVAGQTITAEEVELMPRRVTNLRDVGLDQVSAAVGQVARCDIAVHEMIQAGDLRKLMLIKRKDPVEFYSQVGQIIVRCTGTAMSDGGMGDVISVRDDKNKTVLQGRVTGPAQIRVGDDDKREVVVNELKPIILNKHPQRLTVEN